MQIPGGGIGDKETIIDALRREVQEETGFLISKIKAIGYVLERREDIRNSHDWNRVITYAFSASVEKEVGTNYTKDENADGFKPVWMTIDEFISEKEKLKESTSSYSGCFSDRRDLEIIKYFKKSYH